MIGRALARQGSRPSGPIAPLVGWFLNRETRATNRLAFAALDPQPGDQILEIGFGGGRALARLLGVEGSKVAGLELSAAMVSAAGKHFRDQLEAGRLELAEGEVNAIPFADYRFDRVLTVNTIYFWPDEEQALAEIQRVLRPGGRLVIGTNTKEHMEARWFARYGYHRLYSDAEIRSLLERAGFANVESEHDDFSVATIGEKPGD